MENLTSDLYPKLSSRAPRGYVRTLLSPGGISAADELCTVEDGKFYYGGKVKGEVSPGIKRFTHMGAYTVIMPDKKYYNRVLDEFDSMESTYTSAANSAVFSNGTLYGEEALANTLTVKGADFAKYFRAGDAVTISGCTVCQDNNKTPVIREIEGDALHFYENVFTLNESDSVTEPAAVTISRTVPELDFMCANANRLWGCKGSTVYASKLGDIFNWNVFDGLETDSWAVDVGSSGDFTACVSYLGYPIFFKEDEVCKVYGNMPSNFEVLSSATLGVKKGSDATLAVAGQTLFYLSPAGVAAYKGGVPALISGALGNSIFSKGASGSDGRKYYISMTDEQGVTSLYVYDTAFGLWHREDECSVTHFARHHSKLYMLLSDGTLRTVKGEDGQALDYPVCWQADFGPVFDTSPDKKGIIRLQLRCQMEEGANMEVFIRYDSRGDWVKAASIEADTLRSYVIPIVPRRCDHLELRLCGKGHFTLFSIARTFYSGSILKSTKGRN
ncbi:MAG: hypothetical protein IKM51_00980 [Oscillospiraceae bacterium]|nr:hypothetical protein [Oscillospiraceae bacterium]